MTQADQSAATFDPGDLSDDEVAAFLADNPDFFQRFPDILEMLNIPHEKGTAISLVERQINLLREKNTELQGQLDSLVSVAHDNNETMQQIHHMTVDVLAAQTMEAALEKLTSALGEDFKVEQVAIRLLSDKNHPLDSIDPGYILTSHSARETLDDFTPTNEPLCGRLKDSQLKRLFGEQAKSIDSAVIVPLRKGTLHAVIALGSVNEHRFNPGMDTLYLKRLGELIAAALLRFID